MADDMPDRDARPSRQRGSRGRKRANPADQQDNPRSETDAQSGEGGGRPRRRRRRRRSGGSGGEGGGGDSGDGSRRREREDGGGGGRSRNRKGKRRRGGGGGGGGGGGEQRGKGSQRRGKRRRGKREPAANDPANLLPERDPYTELTSIDPDERIELEIEQSDIEMRAVDILTPIGKGQRGLIVAPPKTGKTTLLQQLARSISENHPEVELIVMLVDERPEEVTAFRRAGHGRVMASSNDESTRRHLKLTAEVQRTAKNLVLEGKDVCILLDSITRMARAHNVGQAGSHRTLSGGLDARALEKPKRFFGAARNVLEGGSLTILATALIDTGSRQDEVIFQEFKGTGNMELQLDRRLAERRVWPAIDIPRSGTRKEEKLFPADEFEGVVALRRALTGMHPVEGMQLLVNRLKMYKTNREFLLDCARRAATAF